MKKILNPKSYISIVIIVAILLFSMFYVVNPASKLKKSDIKSIGLHSIETRYSLWDLGYSTDALGTYDPGAGHPMYNIVLTGAAFDKVKAAVTNSGRSYTLIKKPEFNQELYALYFTLSDKEGLTFITQDLEEEAKGKFIGYKYYDEDADHSNVKLKWIVYINPELGQLLKSFRTK